MYTVGLEAGHRRSGGIELARDALSGSGVTQPCLLMVDKNIGCRTNIARIITENRHAGNLPNIPPMGIYLPWASPRPLLQLPVRFPNIESWSTYVLTSLIPT